MTKTRVGCIGRRAILCAALALTATAAPASISEGDKVIESAAISVAGEEQTVALLVPRRIRLIIKYHRPREA